MVGSVVMIVALLVFPVLVMMSGAPAAAIIGWFLQADREVDYAGTEHLALANGPAEPVDADDDAA